MNKINIGDMLLIIRSTGTGARLAVGNIFFIYKENENYFYYKNLTQNYEASYPKMWFEEDLEKGRLVKL